MTVEPEFLKIREVAERLRVSSMTIHRLIVRGELKAIRVGNRWRIRTDSVQEYLTRES